MTYTRRANANEHFQELRSRHCDEGHVGLSCCGLCQQRLSCAWRSSQHGTFGNLCSQFHVLLGVLKEVDKLHDFQLGFLTPSNIPGPVDCRFVIKIRAQNYLNLTGISVGLMSFAVDSMTPPKRPPPFLPRPPPIISADLLIMNNKKPAKISNLSFNRVQKFIWPTDDDECRQHSSETSCFKLGLIYYRDKIWRLYVNVNLCIF